MAFTLADLSVQASDPLDRGVLRKFGETSSLNRTMPWRKISGSTYSYRVEETLSGIEWRRLNQGYTESTGTWSSRREDVMLLGGEFFVDRAFRRFQRTGGDAVDLIAEQASMKARALSRELERAVIEGDPLVDPDEMMGLRARLTGNQVILAGAGGATLTPAMVDSLLDAVSHDVGRVHLVMNKATRNKLTTLVTAASGAVRINYDSVSDVGERIQKYDGFPIVVIEDDWDASTILDAEDPGDGTADTYSMYAIAFGIEEGVHGLLNGDGPMVDCYQVTKETESGPPGEKWRIECYPGMAMKHPRAAARLRGFTL